MTPLANAVRAALARTRAVLFERFDPTRYLTIGFVAFLATLVDGCTPIIGGGGVAAGIAPTSLFAGTPQLSWISYPLLAIVGILAILAMWLSARGQLIFVESVVYDSARIAEPWKRLGGPARELFLWGLALGLTTLAALALAWAPALVLVRALREESLAGGILATVATGAGLAGAVVALLALGLLWLALGHFVVPLVYRDGEGVGAAWRKLGRLVRRNPGDFVLYGLGLFGLHVVVQALTTAVVIATCCVIDPLLRLPYLNTLIYLPLLVFLRAASIEFLAQFGDDYRIEPGPVELPSVG